MKKTMLIRLIAVMAILMFTVAAMTGSFTVSAETASDAQSATTSDATQTTSTAGTLLYYAVMIGGFGLLAYLFIIRPDKKRKQEAQDLRSSLAVGDKVVTIGGIVGTIVSVKSETIVLDNGLSFQMWAIRSAQKPDIDEVDDDDEDDEE